MFLGEASYRPRTGLVQASYRPRTGAFYRRLEKRRRLRRLRRLFSPWRLKVSTALIRGGSRYATRAFATPIFVASATPIFVASATPYFRISATQTAATPKILF